MDRNVGVALTKERQRAPKSLLDLYRGAHYFMSFKHLRRYVDEFMYRFNAGVDNTLETVGKLIPRMVGKRPT